MKTSVDYLEILMETLGAEWKQELDYFFKDEVDDVNQKDRNCILNFLNACKEDTIEGNTKNLKTVEKLVDNDLVFKNINVYIEGMLKPYFAAAPLRALEVKDRNLVQKVIEATFNEAILRYNPEMLNRYLEYGFENQEALLDYLTALDVLCSFVIERNYCYEAIEDVIYTHMRLSKEACKRIAGLIDDNFDKMKINYIIENISQGLSDRK